MGPASVPGSRAVTRREVLRSGSAAAAAALGGGMVLTGCGSDDGGAGGTALTFLAILPLTSLTFAPELMADAGGYFADQGLDVSFQSTRGSAQAIQLVLAGSAPLTRVGQVEAVIHASTRAAPLMNVGTVIKESTIRFVSSADAPLSEPRDFVGKVIGIPSEGGESEITLDLILAANGVDPADVERQIVGLGPGVFNLVEQGRIAGFSVSIDTAKILERQRPDVAVLRPGDFMESGAQVYMTSEAGLAAHRDTIGRYLQAVRGAIDFMIADDGFDETLRIMRGKYSFGTLEDTEVAKDSLAEYVEVWTSAGRENVLRTVPERWQAGYEELVRTGQAAGGRDASAWFTNDLVPA
jgi:NitT/TauT family transport system substrate-binding protein